MPGFERWVNHILICDVLVVGGGSAGCMAAVRSAESGAKIILADKGHIGRSGSSPFAAGAINICLPDDDHQVWLEEIITRGEYLNDQEWVKIQLAEGFDRMKELQSWGKEYGKRVLEEDDQGNLIRRKARGNINTRTAIINAFPMMDTLRRKVQASGVELVERVMVTDLLLEGERVVGAIGIHCQSAELYLFQARSVVLAAGGCGFKSFFIGHHNLTGEAHYMAYRAGARLRNLDQAMSNTTAKNLDVHGLSHMVGSGGRFLNGQGEEFMWKYDPEVGSRARLTKLVIGMAREVEAGRGPVYMDLTAVCPEDQQMLRKVVPEGFRAFDRLGINPFNQKVEWMPAFMGSLAHGGGIHIDTDCASTIPGLYAAGDASCTPEHGTWSITGLNLTFCFVSGHRAGLAAAGFVRQAPPADWDSPVLKDQLKNHVARLLAPVRRREGITADQVTCQLLEILTPYQVAYLRNETRLLESLKKVRSVSSDQVPRVAARDPHELVKANEVVNMAGVAEMILRSVLFRQESRGFVYREDFPLTDNINWLKWVAVQRGEAGMEVLAQDFPTPYLEPPREKYPPR
ncbi:MAG: FAD-binding protein [Firmicutes bacterium]|nr:FAD-binding protein [Bacillota bacterium]